MQLPKFQHQIFSIALLFCFALKKQSCETLPNLCPKEGLEPCVCTMDSGSQLGSISIDCPPSVSSTQQLTNITNNTNYITTNVSRFILTDSVISGVISSSLWGPLQIKELILDRNKFSIVNNNAFVSSKDQMTFLSLSYNNISYFHYEVVSQLPNLVILNLRGNYLRGFPEESMTNSQTRTIDLSDNKISFLSENAFVGLSNIQQLIMRKNSIAQLESKMFHMEGLNPEVYFELDLSQNSILDISDTTFGGIGAIKLNLTYNLLKSIDENVFLDLVDNGQALVLVNGNPIDCDCDVAWALQTQALTTSFDDFQCNDKNKTFYQLMSDDYEDCDDDDDNI